MLSRAFERWTRAPLAFDVGVLVGVLLSFLLYLGVFMAAVAHSYSLIHGGTP